ncbi:aspartyl/asparaginyl beta-hydroxylase domain-containing protein [Kordiimonas gwangyangensis]|uniref:aspartyl/asparaginyl beta-hydroxylase domain-containing protein n=2 Tax=Kordiimonas gwangyangensis TaxID=288022 RepID=UPI0003827632|nr:aspartyl/asparaginyl beta-hydroxylase domain-containing protein [Kordiimonas gwangyangensis]
MDIGVPIRELGAVECQALISHVQTLKPEVWDLCDIRQKRFDVHRHTKSIVMIFSEGWPDIRLARYPGWDVVAHLAMPIIEKIVRDHYPPGGAIIRAMVANLVKGGVIEEHYDAAPSFAVGHRIHVPLQTNDGVVFTIDGENYKLEVGQGYELNNLLDHSVVNEGGADRYHLIFDYVPPQDGFIQ